MRFGLQLSVRSREIAILLHAFGRECPFEPVALLGHDEMVATQLFVFGVEAPDA